MSGIISVEFSAKNGDIEFKEDSVALKSVEEFFDFIAPGGGCDSIPSEVDEIQMLFLPPEHPNTRNPLADQRVSLQLGMVVFSGPLAEISQTMSVLIDKAGRGELSDTFLTVIGAGQPRTL